MRSRGFRLWLLGYCLVLGWTLVTACAASPASLSTRIIPSPTGEVVSPPDMPQQVDRLAAPVMPPNPVQADYGAQVYYGVCMACHGDRGQGLTDEWRETWGEDANCWQSGCHGPDYPPGGFRIPETCCTAVLGEHTLLRFQNGQELFDYLADTMPWWNPGSLKREEFWQLTAYLMRSHNAITDQIILDESNAAVFSLHPATALPEDSRPQALFIGGLLALVAIILVYSARLHL